MRTIHQIIMCIDIGDAISIVGIVVAIVIGMIGIRISRRSLEFARLTTERERFEWTPAATAEFFDNGTYRSVTITNIHRATFTICGIVFNTDKESVACRGSEIRSSDCKYLPQFLPSGASVTFRIPEPALKQIPVNVTPRVILELPARQTLVCNVC